jgi:hypothetical protein
MSKFELKTIISYPENRQTHKYFISRQEDFDVHCNVYDESCVEYYKGAEKGDFDIYFDESLYEAPECILTLEA